MSGSGKTSTVRASAVASPAPGPEIYQRYAAVLVRQALLNLDDSAPAGQVGCDALVNERALAVMPEYGAGEARYRLAKLVFRRFRRLGLRHVGS